MDAAHHFAEAEKYLQAAATEVDVLDVEGDAVDFVDYLQLANAHRKMAETALAITKAGAPW